MEVDLHGPGIDARGAAFDGASLYVTLGRGRDYAWSATSAARTSSTPSPSTLCEPGGGKPTTASTHYLYRGQCTADGACSSARTPGRRTPPTTRPPGTETLRAERTKLGLVTARAHRQGQAGRLHQAALDLHARGRLGASASRASTTPNVDQVAAPTSSGPPSRSAYTFHWFYADSKHIAYFNAGNNPLRAKGVNPNFPVAARFEWKGFDPDRSARPRYTPFKQHPQVIDQDYIVSWNNKQAPRLPRGRRQLRVQLALPLQLPRGPGPQAASAASAR